MVLGTSIDTFFHGELSQCGNEVRIARASKVDRWCNAACQPERASLELSMSVPYRSVHGYLGEG